MTRISCCEPTLADLTGENVRIGRSCGVNAHLKVSCLAAGRTASMTWTCCGTGRCRRCSAAQVFADLADGPLAHLPSGSFPANAAWLAFAAISHNLLRAAGVPGQPGLRQSERATLRRDLIDVATRTARHGHLTLHMPQDWHRETRWMRLFDATCGPPAAAA